MTVDVLVYSGRVRASTAGVPTPRAPVATADLTHATTMSELGRVLVVLGIAIALVGVVLLLVGRVPWVGRLPGDIHVQRGNWTFYFPLATSLVLSILLTLILWLFGRR
jgi:hypothetical protein